MFIFTGTFQELTAIPSSGKPSLSAIFQTPDAARNSHCNTCLKNESLICTSTPETVAEQKGRVRQLVNLSSETQLRVVIKALRGKKKKNLNLGVGILNLWVFCWSFCEGTHCNRESPRLTSIFKNSSLAFRCPLPTWPPHRALQKCQGGTGSLHGQIQLRLR